MIITLAALAISFAAVTGCKTNKAPQDETQPLPQPESEIKNPFTERKSLPEEDECGTESSEEDTQLPSRYESYPPLQSDASDDRTESDGQESDTESSFFVFTDEFSDHTSRSEPSQEESDTSEDSYEEESSDEESSDEESSEEESSEEESSEEESSEEESSDEESSDEESSEEESYDEESSEEESYDENGEDQPSDEDME